MGRGITLWTRYDRRGASSRLRFFQYLPFLEKAGFSPEIYSFFDDGYLRRLYSGERRSCFGLLKFFRRRLRDMKQAGRDDSPALIEYELLPWMPYFAERSFLSGRKYILNFDDAVDLRYEKIPVLKEKYRKLLSGAAGVIAANEVLMEKFGKFNGNLLKLPTVPPDTVTCGGEKPEKLTLVWTGTPVTFRFLKERTRAFQLAAKSCEYELLIVGGKEALPGVDCRCIPWSESGEAAALAEAHAGVMPLPDTPFARGKSAYKLICYLRAGIPGIASPVGENRRVIVHGENGFLADSDEQWAAAITGLTDRSRLLKLAAGAEASGREYLLEPTAEKLVGFIRRCC